MSKSIPVALLGLGMLSSSAWAGSIQINEIRINQAGADDDEFIEFAGPVGASFDGLTLIVIGDGATASGTIEFVLPLTGQVINANGLFLATEGGTGAVADLITDLNFENSDHVTYLLAQGFSGANGDDLDTDDDGVLDATPWTGLVDGVGLIGEDVPPAADFSYGEALGFEDVGPDGPFVPGHIYRCTPLGDWLLGAFEFGTDDTPGVANQECPPIVLSIVKSGVAGTVPGAELTYTLTIENGGVDPALDVVIIDTLPAGLTFLSEISPENVMLVDSEEPDIEWSVTEVGSQETFEIQLTVLVGEMVEGLVTNQADITTSSQEDDPADNSSSVDTTVFPLVDPPANLFINEIRINEPFDPMNADDVNEYFELRGDPDTSLDGLTYVVIGDGLTSAGSGVVEAFIPLTGNAVGGDGLFIVAQPDVFTLLPPFLLDFTADLAFEDGDNVTHLLVANFSGNTGQDLDTDDDGVLDVTPWTDVIDAVGLIEEMNPPAGTEFSYGAALGFEDVGPDGEFTPAHVYRCDPLGDWVIGLFDPVDAASVDTPAETNEACVVVGLTTSKTGPDTSVAGAQITYTITVESFGLNAAENVSIIDTLPAGLAFVSESSPAEVMLVDSVEPDIEWSLASLAAGETVEIELTAMIDGAVEGEIVNQVDVATTSEGDDP
ncbi:MAG: DUF11 domain-containing protein, partial [Planctomycetota bacterium]